MQRNCVRDGGGKRHSSTQAGQSGAKKGRESGRRLVGPTPGPQPRARQKAGQRGREHNATQPNAREKKQKQTAKHNAPRNATTMPTPAQELGKAARQAGKQPSQENTAALSTAEKSKEANPPSSAAPEMQQQRPPRHKSWEKRPDRQANSHHRRTGPHDARQGGTAGKRVHPAEADRIGGSAGKRLNGWEGSRGTQAQAGMQAADTCSTTPPTPGTSNNRHAVTRSRQ